jgi:transcriptional regulator with XRE-family HTH domain
MRRLRRQQKISLLELVEKTGLSYSHLSRIENDSTMPSADAVARIATTLNGDLGLMLELANCLPQVILERIQRHQGPEPTPSLHRAADVAPGLGEAPTKLRQLVAALGSARGLDTAEATLIAQAVHRLLLLDESQRTALAHLILSMRPDEQAASQ